MTWITRSSSLSLGVSSVKNHVRFKGVRQNTIFCCHILKLSPLNLSSFSSTETEIDTTIGIIGAWAIVGVATWADVVGTTLLASESISMQDCRKCVNFPFPKPILKIIENNM